MATFELFSAMMRTLIIWLITETNVTGDGWDGILNGRLSPLSQPVFACLYRHPASQTVSKSANIMNENCAVSRYLKLMIIWLEDCFMNFCVSEESVIFGFCRKDLLDVNFLFAWVFKSESFTVEIIFIYTKQVKLCRSVRRRFQFRHNDLFLFPIVYHLLPPRIQSNSTNNLLSLPPAFRIWESFRRNREGTAFTGVCLFTFGGGRYPHPSRRATRQAVRLLCSCRRTFLITTTSFHIFFRNCVNFLTPRSLFLILFPIAIQINRLPCWPSRGRQCRTTGESEKSIARRWEKHASKGSTLVLKLRANVTKSQ